MSLITQLLQDLESRRSRPSPAGGDSLRDLIWPGDRADSAPAVGLMAQISRSPILRLAVLGSLLLLVALLLWGAWRVFAPQTASKPAAELLAPSVVAPVPAPAAIETAIPAAPTPVTPNEPAAVTPTAVAPPPEATPAVAVSKVTQIQDLRLSVLTDHTRLVLDATAPLAHQISVEPDRVVIDLEHAALDKPLPVLDLQKGLLKQVQAEPQGAGLRLTLSLKSAVTARTLALAPEQDYGHRLVIDLYPVTTQGHRDPVAQDSASPAATPAPSPPQPAARASGPRSLKQAHRLSAAEQAEQDYLNAVQLLQQDKPGAAEVLLRKVLAHDAEHLKAREALADALLKRALVKQAETVLAAGIKINPEYLLFTKLYARVLLDQGDASAALTALEDQAASAAQDPEYQAFLAALYQRIERHNDAISAYRKALARQPQQGVWWMGLGISLEATQQPPEALEAYRNAQNRGTLAPAVLDFVKARISVLKGRI